MLSGGTGVPHHLIWKQKQPSHSRQIATLTGLLREKAKLNRSQRVRA
jgi:hypothetical protein